MKGNASRSIAFFTERTLAAYLAVSDRTIRNWIRRGELPSYSQGSHRDGTERGAGLAFEHESRGARGSLPRSSQTAVSRSQGTSPCASREGAEL
jgi:excisionase family DNA binding protein